MKNRWHVMMLGVTLCLYLSTAIAEGDIEAGASKTATCVACHGEDGNGVGNPIWPKLAGQHSDYLVRQLSLFRSGSRENALMYGVAATLSDQDIADLSAYYASQTVVHGSADPEQVDLARTLYKGGDASRDIAACAGCHGPNGLGIPFSGFPRLGGQFDAYLVATLTAFRDGAVWGTGRDENLIMAKVAERLTDEEIEALASYISGLY